MSNLKFSNFEDELKSSTRKNVSRYLCNRLFLNGILGFTIGFCLGYFLIILTDPTILTSTSSRFQFDTEPKFRTESQNFIEHSHIGVDTILADKLYDDIKVLCWVLTVPTHHKNRAKHVKLTWGHRCNKLIFISSEDDEDLGAINVNITEGRRSLWKKTRAAFNYIYENYIDEYDWFLKADDDTYIIMENLRYMLREHRSDTPIYFGYKFQMPGVVYMSGGAGYVLSREAVKRLVETAFKNSQICRTQASVEDLEMGVCLQAVGVIAGDSRDEEGKSRFHSLGLTNELQPDNIGDDFWLRHWSYYKFKFGLSDVSDRAISFHYLTSTEMYIMEYLIYHVKPYGIWSIPKNLPKVPLTLDEELNKIREAENDRNLNND